MPVVASEAQHHREGVPGVAPAPRNINAARSEAAFAELSFKAATRVPLPASCQSSAAMFTRGRGTAREKPICKGCPCLSCAMRRSRSRFNCFRWGSQVCHLGGHQATTHICRLQARSAQLCRLRCRAHRRCIHLSGWHGERREGNGRKQGQTEGVVAIHGRSFGSGAAGGCMSMPSHPGRMRMANLHRLVGANKRMGSLPASAGATLRPRPSFAVPLMIALQGGCRRTSDLRPVPGDPCLASR